MYKKICPACIHREEHIIHPTCTICAGTGALTLGNKAAHFYNPQTISAAIDLTLEAEARKIDTTTNLTQNRKHLLLNKLATLVTKGLLEPYQPQNVTHINKHRGFKLKQTPNNQQPLFNPTPETLVSTKTQPQDKTLINAKHFKPDFYDKTLARGLPTMSASGHPSHLARITDPANPLGDINRQVLQRRAQKTHAQILAQSTLQPVKLRRLKKAS